MKILIIGGTGFIGSKVVTILRQQGHSVIIGAPSDGINTISGEGLEEALKETDIVIDISNSPSLDGDAAIDFFSTSGRNLLGAEIKAGTKHHIALSIVGTDLIDMGYMNAKKVQEDLIKESGLPYTIIRSTQFFEFLPTITGAAIQGTNEAHVSNIAFQPNAADDVAVLISSIAVSDPVNGIVNIAGPEPGTMSDFVTFYLKGVGRGEHVVTNNRGEYFGVLIPHSALVPQGVARLGETNFNQWLTIQNQGMHNH